MQQTENLKETDADLKKKIEGTVAGLKEAIKARKRPLQICKRTSKILKKLKRMLKVQRIKTRGCRTGAALATI